MQRCLVEIDFEIVFGLRVFYIPVNVHYARCPLKYLFNLGGKLNLPFVVRAINFCEQRLQHRRPWWDFGYLDAGTERLGKLDQFGTESTGNFVSLGFAIVTREQIYLDVSLVRLIAQEVMPHQTVN